MPKTLGLFNLLLEKQNNYFICCNRMYNFAARKKNYEN